VTIWAAQTGRVSRWLADPRLVELLELHRQSTVHVLLAGGSSGGRAALAQAFHETSPVSTGPLLMLDCRHDEGMLAESASRRLSVAAATDRAGDPLRGTERGTLFLDHIEALSPEVQRLLLEVLRERGTAPGTWVGRLIAGWGGGQGDGASGERLFRQLLDCLDKVRWELGPVISREARG